jgi:hypothetical protein
MISVSTIYETVRSVLLKQYTDVCGLQLILVDAK